MITNLKTNGFKNGGINAIGAGSLFTTGNVIYVNSTTGSDGNIGTDPSQPVATIGQAQTIATASQGDIVVVMPGYTETRTTALTLSKAGVSYVGLGGGLSRPSITGNAAIDAIDITGANITLDNFQFPAPSTDDQTSDINVSGAGVTIRNTYHIGSQTAKNKTDIITVASGANDLSISGSQFYNVTVDCVSAISLEAAVARPVLSNLLIQGSWSTAAIMDEATATLVTIEKSIVKNTKAATAVLSFANNSTGVCSFLHVSGRHTTIASNIATGTGMDFFEVRTTEEAALNGAIIPAADAD